MPSRRFATLGASDSDERRNLDIEALRAYAVIVTMVAHLVTLVPAWAPRLGFFWLGGGVDLFFAISGFVITSSLVRARRHASGFADVSIPFWTKRVFRLWPAAAFWVVVAILCARFFNSSGVFGSFGDTVITGIAALSQVANFHIVSCAALHYAGTCTGNALWVYWSLSLEEQFYILFPFVLLFVPRRRLVAGALVLALAQTFLYRPNPQPLWFFRTDALLFGICIAVFAGSPLYQRMRVDGLAAAWVRVPLAIGLLAMLVLVANESVVWFYNGLVALVAAALVLLASFDRGLIVSGAPLRFVAGVVGARSYSLYLVHTIAFMAVREAATRWGLPPDFASPSERFLVVLCAAATTIVLSEFSYRVVERPLRVYGRRLSGRILRAPEALESARTVPEQVAADLVGS